VRYARSISFHAEDVVKRRRSEGTGDKATQETNYDHKTVSFVALRKERKEAEGLRKTMQALI
jgi:hypothetical protein